MYLFSTFLLSLLLNIASALILILFNRTTLLRGIPAFTTEALAFRLFDIIFHTNSQRRPRASLRFSTLSVLIFILGNRNRVCIFNRYHSVALAPQFYLQLFNRILLLFFISTTATVKRAFQKFCISPLTRFLSKLVLTRKPFQIYIFNLGFISYKNDTWPHHYRSSTFSQHFYHVCLDRTSLLYLNLLSVSASVKRACQSPTFILLKFVMRKLQAHRSFSLHEFWVFCPLPKQSTNSHLLQLLDLCSTIIFVSTFQLDVTALPHFSVSHS